jgi:hypothetical protein
MSDDDVIEWSPEPGVLLTSGEVPDIIRGVSPITTPEPPTKEQLLAKLLELQAQIEALDP